MNKFNQVLNVIIISLMIICTIAFAINVIVFGVGEFQTNTLSYYLLIMVVSTIALLLTPKIDLYEGYTPEPDRSAEYEAIQRAIYEAEEEAATKSQHSIFDDIQEWY